MLIKKDESTSEIKYSRLRICAFGLMIIGFIVNIIYFSLNGKNLLNSDASAEIMVASLANENLSLLPPKDWFYSTELRMFNTPMIYQIGLTIFPENWHMVRIVSNIIFMVILILAIMYLVHALKLGEISFFMLTMLMFPFGTWYALYVLYTNQYHLYSIFSIICLGLIIQLSRDLKGRLCVGAYYRGGKKSLTLIAIQIFILVFLAFMTGLNGIRQLQVFFAPLLAAASIIFVVDVIKGKKGLNNGLISNRIITKGLVFSFIGCVFAIGGNLINSKILSKIYHFDQFFDLTFNRLDIISNLRGLSDFIGDFGWRVGADIVSIAGIANILGLSFGILGICLIVYILKHIEKLNYEELLLTLYFCISLVLNLILMYSTDKGGNGSYFLPIVPFFIAIYGIGITMFIRNEGEKLIGGNRIVFYKHVETCLIIMGTCLIGFLSVSTMQEPLDPIVFREEKIQPVVNWIVENELPNGYKNGVADFGKSNLVTELTNGEIEMWTVLASKDGFGGAEQWLQRVSHCENWPEGALFLLIDTKEYYEFFERIPDIKRYMVYEDDWYRIMNFQSIEELRNLYPQIDGEDEMD